jgi:glucokinase
MSVHWGQTLLVGDVGGTNARFALAHMVSGKPVLENHQSFVAGAVANGEIDLTNSPWAVSETELGTLGLKPVRLINDFEALAWGAPVVPADQLASLGGPDEGEPHCTIAVLGPGTGFGVSALARDIHGSEIAMPGEGGHVCFAPGDAVEDEILRILRKRYDRVSIG